MLTRTIALGFFILLAQGIIFFGHWVIYKTLLHFLGIARPEDLRLLRVIFVILGLVFVLATLLASRFIGPLFDWIYAGAATWMGMVHFLVLASILFWMMIGITGYFGVHIPLRPLGISLFSLAIIISAYGIYHSYNTRIVPYDVRIPNLPVKWKNKRIAMVSDIHLGNARGVRFIANLVERINAEKPYAVLIPGDYFDGTHANFAALTEPLRELTAPNGTYFSHGNHEEFQNSTAYDNVLSQAGVHVLTNTVEDVGGLQFIGVPFSGSNSGSELDATLSRIPFDRAKPSILLKHAPSAPDTAARAGISLMVSGHTHRGQLWPYNYITSLIYGEFAYGMNSIGDFTSITSSGAGTWGPPQRVGTQSEIVIITLR